MRYFTQRRIRAVFAHFDGKGESGATPVLALYRLAIGKKRFSEWPSEPDAEGNQPPKLTLGAPKPLIDFVWPLAIDFDKRNMDRTLFLAGGAWLNYGFYHLDHPGVNATVGWRE